MQPGSRIKSGKTEYNLHFALVFFNEVTDFKTIAEFQIRFFNCLPVLDTESSKNINVLCNLDPGSSPGRQSVVQFCTSLFQRSDRLN